jgi:hypothetical protein
LLAPADTQALQQSTVAEAPVPGNCNAVPMEIAQPTNLICDPVNPIRYPASREERPGHANGRVTPNAGGAQEQVESQAAVHPEGIRPSLRQDNIIGGQIGQIFMFGEHPQCGRGVPTPVSKLAQGVARSANEGINQLEHTLNSQGRGRGESEGSQLQVTQTQTRLWPVLDLNRPQGSRSWSMGRTSTSGRNEQDLQLISELRTEGAFFSSGTTIRSRVRGYRDMTSYSGWLASQGIRTNGPGPPLQPRFSNRLQRRTSSMANGNQLRAERINQFRNRPSYGIQNAIENVSSPQNPTPHPLS